jgi:hypothetical protein
MGHFLLPAFYGQSGCRRKENKKYVSETYFLKNATAMSVGIVESRK